MKWHMMKTTICLFIMGHVPKRVLYWAIIQAWVYATQYYSDKTLDEITWSDVCKLLKGKK